MDKWREVEGGAIAMTNEKCNMANGKWYDYCDPGSGMRIAVYISEYL
jgi:hypothetical protein